MEAINPFADPEFKKQILAKEKKNVKYSDPEDYEIIESEPETKSDLKSLISGAPNLPKAAKNLILDATALAKNEKEQKVKEMEMSLNQVLTKYNEDYGLSLHLNLGDLSKSLVDVADPKKRRVLELYVSELYSSVKPLLYLHLIQKLYLAMDYILSPERLFNSGDLTTADMFLVVEKLISYIDQISQLQSEVAVKGADLELRQLGEDMQDDGIDTEENREAVENFMRLFNKESGID